ncbi:MAG: cupin domain-containing protein [Gracilibacteraceae bacterium]|jgi:uncharacterized cupin superfamily protein|nr:cupin domain-containing protein [Gracilibacteraceae bacterium]
MTDYTLIRSRRRTAAAETEFVALLEGNAAIEYLNGKTATLSKGDTLLIMIKPHERHKVSYTSTEPPVWLCVFY